MPLRFSPMQTDQYNTCIRIRLDRSSSDQKMGLAERNLYAGSLPGHAWLSATIHNWLVALIP